MISNITSASAPLDRLPNDVPATPAQRGQRISGQNLLSAEQSPSADKSELKEAFDDFVGQTFYGLMLKQLRQSVNKPAYFHGGRGEEVFQGQLDQIIAEKLSDSDNGSMSQSMFDLFQLPRH